MMTEDTRLVEQVFSEYRTRIFGYIAGKNVPPSDRDDVFSEILLKATQQAQRYDSARASVSTWVYTITRSVVIDYFRRQKQQSPLSEWLAADGNVEDAIEYEDELRQLAHHLERLPDRERSVIILRLYKGMEYSEIARTMSLTDLNARKVYSRAIERLRKWMGDDE